MYHCQSVVGGWQTALKPTNETFGPVFNDIKDLWAWQEQNLSDVHRVTIEQLEQQNAELLAALEDMLEVFGGHSDEDCPAESRARAAIAKAKGE